MNNLSLVRSQCIGTLRVLLYCFMHVTRRLYSNTDETTGYEDGCRFYCLIYLDCSRIRKSIEPITRGKMTFLIEFSFLAYFNSVLVLYEFCYIASCMSPDVYIQTQMKPQGMKMGFCGRN
jgi:hypothetical protein